MSENGVIRYADICGKCKNCSIPTCAGVCEGRPSDFNVHATDTNKKTDKHPDNLINLNTSNAIPGVYPNNLIDRSNDQWPVIGDCQINVQREMRTMTDDNAVDFHIDDNASSDFKVDVTHDEMGGDVVGISGDAETVNAENSRDAAHLFLKCKPIELLMDKGMQENVFNTNNSVVVNINNACNAKDVASRTEVESVTQERSAVGLDKASNTISSVCSYKFTIKCNRCKMPIIKGACSCKSCPKIRNFNRNVTSDTSNVANSNKKPAIVKCKRSQKSTGNAASFCASRIKITNVTSVATSAFPNVPPATANAADNSNATVACNNCQKPNKYGALICQKADAHASRGHCTSCHKPIVDGVCGCRVRVSPGFVKCRQCQLNFVNGKCGCRQVNAYTKRRQRRNMELVISEVDKRSTSRTMTDDNAVDFHIDDNASSDFKVDVTHDEMGGDVVGISGDAETVHAENSRDAAHLFLKCKPIELLMDKGMQENVFNTNNSVVVNINNACNAKDVASRTEVESVTQERSAVGLDKASNTISSVCSYKFTIKCNRCKMPIIKGACSCKSCPKIRNFNRNVTSNTSNVANSNKKPAIVKCKRSQKSTGNAASFCASRIKITNVTSVATSAFPNVPPATANAADNSNATVACNNCQKPNKYGALICQKADAHASRGHCTSCHKPIVDGVCGCRVRVSPGFVKCRQCQLNFVNGKCGCRQVNAYTKRRQRRNMELVISEVDKRSTSGGDAGGDDVDESHVPSDGSMSYSDNQETDEEMAFGVRKRGERFVKSIPGHSKRRVTLPNKEQIQRDTKLMPVAQVAPITKNTGDTVPDYEELQALITIEQISEATGRRERRRRDYCCLSRWSRAKNDAHRRQAKRADKRYIDLDWHKRLHKFACDCCCPYLMRGVPPKNTIRREEVWKIFRNIVGSKDDSESQSDENDSGKTKKRKRKCDKDNDGETKKYPTNHSLDSTDPMKDHEEWLRQKSDFKRFFTLGQIAGKNTEESNESTANVSTMKVHTDMLKTKAKAVRKDLAEGKPVIDRKRAENATDETISDDREQKQEAGEEIQTKSIRQRTRKIVRNKLVTQQRGNAEQIEDDLKEWIRQKNSVLPILKKSSNEKSIYNNNDDQLVMDTEIVKECLNNEDSNPNENNGVIEQASTNKSESQSLKWKSDGDCEWTMLEKDPKKIFNFNTNTILDMLYSKEACTSTEINNTVKKPAKTSTDDTIIIESSDEESDSDKNKHTAASVDKTQFSDDGTTEEAVRNADEEKGDDENNEMDVSDAVELSSDNEAQEQTQDADNKKAVIDNLANTHANTVQEIADENVTAKCGLDNNTETIPANRTGVGKSVFTLPSNIARNMIIHPLPGMQPGVQMMAPPKLNTLQTYMTRPILVIPAKLVDGNTTRPILLNMVPTETEPAPSQPNVVAPLTAVNVAQHDKIQDSIPTDLYTSNLLADASGTTRDLTFPTSK